MLTYRIELTPDDNDTVMVTCPALPEVATFGDDETDARRHAAEAIEEALAARVAAWGEVPADDGGGDVFVRVSLQAALKTLLFIACRSAGVTRAELVRRLGWHREQVDRLFRFDHATRLDQFEAAFAAVGHAVELDLIAAQTWV